MTSPASASITVACSSRNRSWKAALASLALQLLVDCLGDGDMGEDYQLPDGKTVKRSAHPQLRPYVWKTLLSLSNTGVTLLG